MAGVIKKHFPKSNVVFLGRTYTKDIIALSENIDGFLNYDEIEKMPKREAVNILKSVNADIFLHVFPKKEIASLAKASGIPLRVGTTNRLFHWFNCNKLIVLSRKNSNLHESQLNLKLLQFLNINTDVELSNIFTYYGLSKIPPLDQVFSSLIDISKINIILHPKSRGSAKEWGLENFTKLIHLLPKDKYTVFVSGTADDASQMQDFLHGHPDVISLAGKLSLSQFIAFIFKCDALIAASTGPLHIAAALNKKAIGIFSPKRPIHPGRWMPIGKNARYVVYDANCELCKNKIDCDCITKISAKQIVNLLEEK